MYIVYTHEENGKYYTWAEKYTSCNNIVSMLRRYNHSINIIEAAVFTTKKAAAESVRVQRESYKVNGTALYE